jgi:hypothetical protein
MKKTKIKSTIKYYNNNMDAFNALRQYAIDNAGGEYYCNNWRYMYKLQDIIYAVDLNEHGFYIGSYKIEIID